MPHAVNITLPSKEAADLLAELVVNGRFQSWLNGELQDNHIPGQLREYAEKADIDLFKPRLTTHALTIKPLYGE